MTKHNITAQDDLNAAYNGEVQISLSQAVARLAAEFYDPMIRNDRDTGQPVEVNADAWPQRLLIQAVANFAWTQLHDPRTYTVAGSTAQRVKGLVHKLDKAREFTRQVNANNDGTELRLKACINAAEWQARLESQVETMEEMYHTAADIFEAATGDAFKPYEPWGKTFGERPVESQQASDEMRQKAAEAMAAVGLTLNESASQVKLDHDGVDAAAEIAA